MTSTAEAVSVVRREKAGWMMPARLLRICAALQGRVDAFLPRFAAAILVGLA
jgi:hypothetical protein